jgi:predicted RNA-binding Zn-ribbon protein involved in translation (DUF1610 family)
MNEKPVCEWRYEDFHDYYDTSCGKALVLEGGLEINANAGYTFCPYCGKVIIGVKNDQE